MIEIFNLYMNDYYDKNKFAIIIFIITSISLIILESVVIPYHFGKIISNINNPIKYLVIISGLYLLIYFLFFFKKLYENNLIPDILTVSRYNLFSSIIDKYSENYKSLKMGSTISKINQITGYFKICLLHFIGNILPNYLILLFISIFILFINFNLGLILILSVILSSIFILIFKDNIFKLKTKTENFFYKVDNILIDVYSSLMNTYLYNNETKEKDKIKNNQNIYNIYLKDVGNLESNLSNILYFISLCTSVISVLYILHSVKDNKSKILLLILLIYFINSNILIAKHIAWWLETYGLVESSKSYVKNILNINSVQGDKEVNTGNLELKNVNFYYKKNIYILKNLNLVIKNKEKIAIIGRSGSGKSTLSKLLLKFYKYDGFITLNNINIQNINTRYLRRKIIYANQKTVLYDTTVMDNIKYGNNADSQYVLKLMNDYELLEIFNGLKNGIYNEAGVQGNELSGGMQKIVIIMRTILKAEENNSLIVIFDEPLAGLDSKTRSKVIKLIKYKCSDKTLIIITHDKEILPYVDRIIDMNEINNKIFKKKIKI